MVWGLPRCVWARESTAPAQGNQSLRPRSGAAAALHWSGCEEIPHVQNQRNPSKSACPHRGVGKMPASVLPGPRRKAGRRGNWHSCWPETGSSHLQWDREWLGQGVPGAGQGRSLFPRPPMLGRAQACSGGVDAYRPVFSRDSCPSPWAPTQMRMVSVPVLLSVGGPLSTTRMGRRNMSAGRESVQKAREESGCQCGWVGQAQERGDRWVSIRSGASDKWIASPVSSFSNRESRHLHRTHLPLPQRALCGQEQPPV